MHRAVDSCHAHVRQSGRLPSTPQVTRSPRASAQEPRQQLLPQIARHTPQSKGHEGPLAPRSNPSDCQYSMVAAHPHSDSAMWQTTGLPHSLAPQAAGSPSASAEFAGPGSLPKRRESHIPVRALQTVPTTGLPRSCKRATTRIQRCRAAPGLCCLRFPSDSREASLTRRRIPGASPDTPA